MAPVIWAASDLDYRVDTATEILQDLRRIPENAIPPNLLSRAYAIAVIPSVVKAGFIFGGSYGRGIIVARRPDGQWSNPSFLRLISASFGFQAGVESTDLILVFKSQRALEGLSRGKITLGGDASIAAGPVGRTATASTDAQMQSEIYSYSRSRGLFAGFSITGADLSMDREANDEFYQGSRATPAAILTDNTIPAPAPARRFLDTLAATAPPLQGHAPARAASRDADMEVAPPAGAKTFGVDEAGQPANNGNF
jgi:lipid-binding SYLF domain-containing protein